MEHHLYDVHARPADGEEQLAAPSDFGALKQSREQLLVKLDVAAAIRSLRRVDHAHQLDTGGTRLLDRRRDPSQLLPLLGAG